MVTQNKHCEGVFFGSGSLSYHFSLFYKLNNNWSVEKTISGL